MSCYANDNQYPSTGEQDNSNIIDSVLIAYDDLRIVNSKLIELEYTKEINNNLYKVIYNDSIIIKEYKLENNKLNEDIKNYVKERNVCFGVGLFSLITTFIALFIK